MKEQMEFRRPSTVGRKHHVCHIVVDRNLLCLQERHGKFCMTAVKEIFC